MEDYKNRIEAVLFVTGKFMTAEEMGELTGIASPGVLKEAIAQLVKDYKERPGALQIFEENGKYKLNIKKEFNYLTPKLLSSTEFDRPTQETLAVIAYKQPAALQAEIVKIRGTTAYDHIKTLKEAELITSEKHGRTRLLKLAPKFFDYFDVVEAELKDKFKEVGEKIEEVEEVTEEDVQKRIEEAEKIKKEIEKEEAQKESEKEETDSDEV